MLPRLLVKLKSPTVILNPCFDILLEQLQKFEEKELLFALIIVACALNKCVRVHFLEATDLQVRLDTVFRMIKRCMDTPSMDIQENVMQVLQDPFYQSRVGKEYPEITMARSFEKGPLVYCMQYDLHSVLGIEQISKYIKEVFDKFLSSSSVRPTHTFKDLFQIRSKFGFVRSCPLAMLVMEGLSKLVLFILILLTIRRHNKYDDNNNDPNEMFSSIYEKLLLIWITGNWLHELGEYFQVYKSIYEYFSIWNALDTSCNLLLTAWFASVLNYRLDVARIFLSVSAIPTSLCLLRYLSASKNVGVLVLTIVAVLRGSWNFLLVLILILAGFGVALFGLMPDKFSDFGNIVGRLFYYGLAGVELSSDYEETNTVFDIIGKIVLVPFVVLTMIVLMNLVIAKMTATFGAFQKSLMERWSMMKATQTKEFLLIHESHPLSMLPPPLNLITAALLPFHYGCPYLSDTLASWSGELVTADSISAVSISGTVSDFLLRLLYALPIFRPFHETFLCLNDVYTQSQDLWCLGRYILLSPVIACCYVGILLKNAFRLTEVKSIPNSVSDEICGYGRRVISQYPINRFPVNGEERVRHTVEIKCLHYEAIPMRNKLSDEQSHHIDNDEVEDVLPFHPVSTQDNLIFFTRTTHYVKIIYRDQILQTKKVEVKNYVKSKTFFCDKKNFHIFNGDESIAIELWERNDSSYYSDVIIGRRVFPLRKWIANGRFEGKINLTSKEDGRIGQEDVDTIIGNISLVVRRIQFTEGSKAFDDDQELRNQIEHQVTTGTLFTEEDKTRIFNCQPENKPQFEIKTSTTLP